MTNIPDHIPLIHAQYQSNFVATTQQYQQNTLFDYSNQTTSFNTFYELHLWFTGSVLAFNMLDHKFVLQLGQTKDYICIKLVFVAFPLSAQH